MKALIQRLFQHDVLTCAEARRLMAALTGGNLPEALTAALLAAFSMRSPRVDELIGFRQALIEAAVPVDLSDYGAIDIVGTGGDGKTRSTFPPAPALWWPRRATPWPNTATTAPPP